MFTTKRFGIAFGFAVACGALQASPVSVHASQGVSRPRADLRSAVKTVSISGSKTSREAFEELAQRAGIRVVFHREFVNTTRKPTSLRRWICSPSRQATSG
jgi:hypothetical protein